MGADVVAWPKARQPARVTATAATYMLLWLVSYLAFALLTHWLWDVHGAASGELLFWQAKRRLVLDASPPNAMLLWLATPPLVFYALLPSGSAFHATALLGATGITAVAYLLRRLHAPGLWLFLLALHPAVLFSATQYPSVFMRSLLLALTLFFLLDYLRSPVTSRVFFAALALGTLALVDLQAWPLWVYLGVALVWTQRRARAEHLTLLLVIFFPALFITVGRGYLVWMWSDSYFYQRLAPYAQLESLRYWLPNGPALSSFAPLLVGNLWLRWSDALAALAYYVPAYFVLVPFALLRLSVRLRRWYRLPLRWQGLGLAFTVPLFDLLWRHSAGQARVPVLEMTAPLLIVALLLRELHLGPRLRALTTWLLLGGLLTGWLLVWQEGGRSEPQQLARQAITQESVLPSVAFRQMADALDRQMLPGQRVLLDDVTLFPLVGAVGDARALILSHQFAYSLAIQNPYRYADYIVVASPDSPLGRARLPGHSPQRLDGYALIFQSGDLLLYERR